MLDDHFQFWHLRTSRILLPGSMVPLDMEVSGNFARCVCCFLFFPVSDFTGFSWIFETTSRNSVFWRSSLANAGNLRKFQLNSIRTSMITWDPRGDLSFLEINSERNQFAVATQIFLVVATSSRWWQLKYFCIFPPYLGKIPILTIMFQRGWNHQPVPTARGHTAQ